MAESLIVYMDGVRCGAIVQTSAGDLRFHYDEQYRAASGATPLSLSMPLVLAEHRKRVVLPFLDGLITDSAAAREAIARRYGVSPANPFAILRHVGADVAGALQILPEDVVSTGAEGARNRFRLLSNGEVAEQLSDVVEEYRDGRVPPGLTGRFSLVGAQPKTALLRTPEGQ